MPRHHQQSKPASSRRFLTLHAATFRAGDAAVFERTSWTWYAGEHWAVVGPNGSGKTLFAAALRGQIPVIRGELTYHFPPPAGHTHEQAIDHVAFETQKAIVTDGFVQSRWNSIATDGALRVSALLSRRRVENINPYEIRREPRGAQRAYIQRRRRAIAAMQIAPLLNRKLMTLSNGEMRKVTLARALCRPLRLLILDDPFVGLDGRSRRHLQAVLQRLMRGALRVLFITSRPEDLPRGITHVLALKECRVVGQGPIENCLSELQGLSRAGTPWTAAAGAECRPGLGGDLSRSFAILGWRAPPMRPGSARLAQGEGALGARPDMVRLRDVTVRYGAATILRGVSWTIRAGESWALLGPNGSGKSTLLSLLLADNPQAYANDVEVFGIRRGSGESIWDIKRRIGWVSPELHLHGDETLPCLDTVLQGFVEDDGRRAVSARRRLQARRWLAHLGLEQYAAEPLGALSAGSQRLVLLARAMVAAPELLVLDEPGQGLDAPHRALLVRAVDAVIRGTTTSVIYVTHRPDEIPSSIHRVLRLRAGRVVYRGPLTPRGR